MDNTKVSEKSNGWRHRITPNPDGPQDTSRMVRTANATEYLIWNMPEPGFQSYQAVVYVHGDAVDVLPSTVQLSVRAEGDTDWKEVTYTAERAGVTADGWHKVIVSGAIDAIRTPVQFRLLLKEGDLAADHLQISRVSFAGIRY